MAGAISGRVTVRRTSRKFAPTFSRPGSVFVTRVKPPDSREVEVASFIDEQLQRVAIPATITVQREIDPSLPTIQADPVQIGQVLYNVLTNAVQAMDNMGGTLTVRGRRHNGVATGRSPAGMRPGAAVTPTG